MKFDYDNMDDGENFLYWAKGIMPEQFKRENEMKSIVERQIEYVISLMNRYKTNNVSTYAPKLSDANIKELQKHFNIVKREPIGFVYFAR